LNRRLYGGLFVAALAIILAGCGEPQLPETPAGASRSMIENPLGKAADTKQSKVSAKAKAAYEKAAGSDPRGK
jgi:hypothetical protein